MMHKYTQSCRNGKAVFLSLVNIFQVVDIRLVAGLCMPPVTRLIDPDALTLGDLGPLLPGLPLHLQVVTIERCSWLVRWHTQDAIQRQQMVPIPCIAQFGMTQLVQEPPLGDLWATALADTDLRSNEEEGELAACEDLEALSLCDLLQLLHVVLHGITDCRWLVDQLMVQIYPIAAKPESEKFIQMKKKTGGRLTSCSSTDRSPLESFTSLILQGTRVLVRSIYQPNHGYVSVLVLILF